MAVTIVPQLIEGHSIRVGDYGIEVVRPYFVYGALGTSSALVEALADPSAPTYGMVDPQIPGIFCRSIRFEPFPRKSRAQAIIVATFMPPDFSYAFSPVVKFSAITVERETNFPALPPGQLAANPVYVGYTGASGQPSKDVMARFVYGKRLGLLEIDRMEASQPSSAVLALIGTINNAPFQGQPAKTWYCRNIAFEKELYRSNWRVHYEFEYDSEFHIETAMWVNPVTGEVPLNIQVNRAAASGNGYANRDRGYPANFGILNLPTVFS